MLNCRQSSSSVLHQQQLTQNLLELLLCLITIRPDQWLKSGCLLLVYGCFCQVVVLQHSVIAQDLSVEDHKASPDTTGNVELAKLVQQLTSSPSFEVRERAMYQLWERYDESRTFVERIALDADPEVARRGRWILDRWEIGLLPELPWEMRKKLASAANDPASAFVTLIDAQRLREASEVARMASNTRDPSSQFQQEIRAIVVQRYTELVHLAIKADDLEPLIGLLDACATSTDLAVARALLLHRSQREVNDDNILPKCATSLAKLEQKEIAAICWTMLGDFEKGIQLANELRDPTVLSKILTAAERWEELAVLSSESVDDTLPPDASITQYASWLMSAKFAGDQQQVDAVTKILMENEGRAPLRWRTLAAAGKTDEAIEMAKAIEPMAAVDLLRSQMRFDEAFKLLNVDPAHPQPDLDRLLELIAKSFKDTTNDGETLLGDSQALEILGTAIELLSAVGIDGAIEPTIFKLSQLKDGSDERRGLYQALFVARRINRVDLLPKLLASLSEPGNIDLSRIPYSIVTTFAYRSLTLFQRLAAAISKNHAELTALEQWGLFFELTSGQLPQNWDRNTDLDALYDAMMIEPQTSQRSILNGGSISYSIAEFFAALGRSDLAQECYMRAIGPLQNPIAGMKFAKYQLASGDPEGALVLLDMVAEQAYQPIFSGRYLSADPSDAVMPTPSSILLAKSIALRRLGRTEEAEIIDKTLHLAPIQPSEDSGEDYLAHLAEFSEVDRLKSDGPYEFRRCVMSRLGNERHQYYFRFAAAASAIAEEDPETSFRWHRMGFASTLSQLSIYPRYYAIVPANIYATEAIAAANRGEESAARAALQNALQNYPVDISLAEDVLPKIRQSGLVELADKTLDSIFQAGIRYTSDYPQDASTLNNLAWVSAINGRNYETSLELSRQAVFLEPDSVSYRDTLAEILFRLGRVEEAIALEKQCLQDQPAHWHLHQQLERFANPE